MTTSRDPRRDPRLLSRIVQPPGLPVPKPVMAGAAVRHSGIQVQVTGLDDNWTNYLAAELEQKAIQLGPNRGEAMNSVQSLFFFNSLIVRNMIKYFMTYSALSILSL